MPNLIEVQKKSYEQFLNSTPLDMEKNNFIKQGLFQVFDSIFPIKDFSEASELEFISFNLDRPKYDVEECRQRGLTFAAPLRVKFRLIIILLMIIKYLVKIITIFIKIVYNIFK